MSASPTIKPRSPSRVPAQDCPAKKKTRFFVPCGDLVWDVDVHSGILAGVVIAEIELPAEDTPFDRPSRVGVEATGRTEYRKITMLSARLSGKQRWPRVSARPSRLDQTSSAVAVSCRKDRVYRCRQVWPQRL